LIPGRSPQALVSFAVVLVCDLGSVKAASYDKWRWIALKFLVLSKFVARKFIQQQLIAVQVIQVWQVRPLTAVVGDTF